MSIYIKPHILIVVTLLTTLFIVGYCIFFTPTKYIINGDAQIKSGKTAKAISILEQGLKQFPNDPTIKFKLAQSYLLSGEIDTANKIIINNKKSLALLMSNKDFQDFLVELSFTNKRAENKKYAGIFAEKYLKYQTLNENSKRVAANYLKIGQVLEKKSVLLWEKAYNIAHALKEHKLTEDLRALLLPRYFQIATNLKLNKKYIKALSVLKKAHILGKNAKVSFQEGLINFKLGKIDLAQKQLEEAIQLESDNDDYKLTYANILKHAASDTKDQHKRDEYFNKIRLLLSSGNENSRKASFLKRVTNLNAKYKIPQADLTITELGDYLYPTFGFSISQDNLEIKDCKIIFLDSGMNEIDVYESSVSSSELGQPLEITSKNPISNEDTNIYAQVFLNGEFVKEYKTGIRIED